MKIHDAPLLITALIAVLAPLICEIPVPLRMPMIVLEIAFGILVGPHLLKLAQPDGMLAVLSYIGLIFLFFLAGMEIDLRRIQGRPLSLAVKGWFFSLVVAFLISWGLYKAGFILTPHLVAVALTTTALSVLFPMLRDSGELETRFGKYVTAAGAVGEFGPIVAISLLFTREDHQIVQIALLVLFIVVAVVAAYLTLLPTPPRMVAFFTRTMETASQLPVRFAILLLAILIVLAERFGLGMVLGAFSAAMVIGLGTNSEKGYVLRHKLDAIGFGFLIPMFFVTSGMRFGLNALLSGPQTYMRVPVFLVLFLVVRGLPTLLYRRHLPSQQLAPLALYSATELPLIVAITELGVRSGRMQPDNAAALVGAGMLSVLLFPLAASVLRRRAQAPVQALSTSIAEVNVDGS
ncbi:MAG TPA: cation:proton antiporter [Terriglobales bacterium]|nr:cation:proton antiporter [Terriglobales bacterium]